MADRAGQQLGNYRLVRKLGEGGFAEAYLGEHIYLGTQAAIKVLKTALASQQEIDQFRVEARTIANLVHPHIVRVLEFGFEQNTPFLVMDYAPNGSLRQHHPQGTRLPLATVVAYVKQAAEALQFAHDQKLIHRDIKPENLLLGRNNEVLLSDFGIAVLLQQGKSHLTVQGFTGTKEYAAPEQFTQKPTVASDQYAFATTIYEWLAGDVPFHAEHWVAMGMKKVQESPPRLSGRVPNLQLTVEQVVLKALAKEPQQRFGSVREFASAFEQACKAGSGISSAATLVRPTATTGPQAAFQPQPPTIPPPQQPTIPAQRPPVDIINRPPPSGQVGGYTKTWLPLYPLQSMPVTSHAYQMLKSKKAEASFWLALGGFLWELAWGVFLSAWKVQLSTFNGYVLVSVPVYLPFIAAVVVGFLARQDIRRSRGQITDRDQHAKLGQLLGCIFMALWVLVMFASGGKF